MSAVTAERNGARQGARIFRGSSLEELVPRIRAELGGDAVITRQRDGLAGGVAGFFQRRFVEVEAVPGNSPLAAPFSQARAAVSRQIDLYDDDASELPPRPPAPRDEALAEGLQSPAIRALLDQAAPFADHLEAAQSDGVAERFEPLAVEEPELAPEPEPEPEPEPRPATPPALRSPLPAAYARPPEPRGTEIVPAVPVAPLLVRRERPAAAASLERGVTDAGITSAIAASLVTEAVSHLAPLEPRTPLRELVREALARRIPVQPSWPRRGRTVGFVGAGGSGKTTCVARLASAYALGSDLPVVCMSLRPADGGESLARLLEPAGVPVHAVASAAEARARAAGIRDHALIVLDTPSVSPGDERAVERLAAELDEISVYEVHLALPATAGSGAAGECVAELEPLGISRLALTHADETRHYGAAVDLALRARIPFSYVSSGTAVPGGLEAADAQRLAAAVVA